MHFLTPLLRRTSQAKRVLYGMGFASAGTLAVSTWAWSALGGGTNAAGVAILATGAAFAGVTMLAAWAVAVSIKAPVEDTAMAVMRIAGGDLVTKVESPGRDELSWLRAELNGMRKKLHKTIEAVRESAAQVAGETAQIAGGNGNLAQRTTSQVDAVQRAAATVSQMAASLKQTAQQASEVDRCIGAARESADSGNAAMREAATRIQQVQRFSSRVSEVITVIDGIAFQTNILALNAAVEAARAGEAGRGFAVVASEVRSLAQRCATAAREVHSLISESNANVHNAATTVVDAGGLIERVRDQVSSAAQLVGALASQSAEQSRAVEVVDESVSSLDAIAQGNLALVEQLGTATGQLDGQVGRLNAAMGAFAVAG